MTEKTNKLGSLLPPNARILVVEDNKANQVLMQQQLEVLGFEANVADNGVQALEYLHCDGYELLLTDINMPRMDGFELVASIRKAEQETGAHLPVIAVTGNAMAEDGERCLERGMDDFVAKPVRLKELKAVLKKWMPEKHSSEAMPILYGSNDDAVGEVANVQPESPVDLGTLIGLVGDDHDRHCQLFEAFVDTTPEIIEVIQVARQDRAADAVWQQAHKLKSSARSMGADQLADACRALENAGKANRWDEIDKLAPQLVDSFKAVKIHVERYCVQKEPAEETRIAVHGGEFRVLLIDDDRVMLNVGTIILNDLGVQSVSTVTAGEEALALLDDETTNFDLIMCDLNMPGMDGVAFLRHLAKRAYAGAILLVSGEDERIIRTSARLAAEHRLNVMGFLEKPIKPSEVMEVLGKLQEMAVKDSSGGASQPQLTVTVDELRHAIANNELVTFYQPKVDVISRKVVAAETLVRWQHPDKGLIAPFHFIPIAEKSGLIDSLTQVVFGQAVQHAADLKASGLDIKIAVNLSVDTLHDLEWPDYALAETKNAGVNPSSIILEITESRLMDDMVSALEILTRLSMSRFALSIDDFGTGYSSMEQLQRIPFSELKIDRAFVHGAAKDKSARAILESSVNLARSLDMSIVAEGVENQEDWDLVVEIGCDQVQGYFIAKPMPVDEWVSWLHEWNARIS